MLGMYLRVRQDRMMVLKSQMHELITRSEV